MAGFSRHMGTIIRHDELLKQAVGHVAGGHGDSTVLYCIGVILTLRNQSMKQSIP